MGTLTWPWLRTYLARMSVWFTPPIILAALQADVYTHVLLELELELELIQTHMIQKPIPRVEVCTRALRASQKVKKRDACLVCSLCLSGYIGVFSEDVGWLALCVISALSFYCLGFLFILSRRQAQHQGQEKIALSQHGRRQNRLPVH